MVGRGRGREEAGDHFSMIGSGRWNRRNNRMMFSIWTEKAVSGTTVASRGVSVDPTKADTVKERKVGATAGASR